MNHSVKIGIAFGLTSGIITTLGLMVGLHSGTHSRPVVIGGIITIAIADAFSDALGIHVSEEAENVHTHREIWTSTLATFVAKFLCALSFLFPLLLLPLPTAIWVSLVWGLALLSLFSHVVAKSQAKRSLPAVAEHLAVAVAVISLTHALGDWISTWAY
jgi:VIT1/CCC1 family predicted Fe2+/Mn2+ transporter